MKSSVMALLLLVSSGSYASEYEEQVEAQLEMIETSARESGWDIVFSGVSGSLKNGASKIVPLDLSDTSEYMFVGVCDDDCSDLDLTLLDENLNVVSEDVTADSMPVVEADPKWAGGFFLKIRMHSCDATPCYYGISMLEK